MAENDYKFQPDREPTRVRYDGTITLGNILTMIGGLILAAGAYVDYRLTSDRHENRITASEASIKGIRDQQAEQSKYQQETTRALDRLTFQIQNVVK